LARDLEAIAHPQLRLVPFPKRLRLVDELPSPIARLEPKKKGVSVRVAFDYRSRLVQSYDSPDWMEVPSEASDELVVLRRQHDAEKRRVTELVRLLTRWSQDDEHHEAALAEGYFDRRFEVHADVNELLTALGPQLIEAGWELRIRDERVTVPRKRLRYAVVGSGEDWFEVQAGYEDNGEFVPLLLEDETAMAATENRKEIVLVSREDLQRLQDLRRLGAEGGRLLVHKNDLGTLDSLSDSIHNPDAHEFAETRRMLGRLREFSGLATVPTPDGFRGTLRSYQQTGLAWLLFLHEYDLGGCLADDMGLGKTIQTLALLQTLKARGELGPCLGVVPVTTMNNWQREVAAFTPELSVAVHSGPGRASDAHTMPEADLLLVSYQTLRRDTELFAQLEFDYLILDEAQYAKNARTATHKAIRAVRARHRLALSGTPIENNTLELWSLLTILSPGLLGTKAEFVRRFAGPIERDGNPRVAELLRRKIRPFMLRRRKQEVATDLPEREEILIYTDMGHRQRRVYERYRETYRRRVEQLMKDGDVMKAMLEIVQGLLKLRQIVLFPGLVDSKYSNYPSCKLERFGEMIDTIIDEGNKALVFSQFVQVLTRLRYQLDRKGVPYAYLDGSTRNRQDEIDRFQSQRELPVFLISLKAGGLGVNLTAAEYVLELFS
jgi:non-specific serine/threonine protein kinase